MRCKTSDGETWTTVRVREMRERLGLAEYNPQVAGPRMVSLAKAAEQLGICVGSPRACGKRQLGAEQKQVAGERVGKQQLRDARGQTIEA
jgi:hypothetical protein